MGYEVHETGGKTKTARRSIELDDTALSVLAGWRAHVKVVSERLARPYSPDRSRLGGRPGEAPEEDRLNSEEHPDNDEGPGR